MSVELKVVGLDRVMKTFKKLSDNARDDTSAMRKIGTMGEKFVLGNFANESGPNGPWPPLKKPRKRGGSKILHDTGYLRSATQSYAKQHTAIVYNATSYAPYHNSDRPRKRLPQRKFLWFSTKNVAMFAREYLKWLFRIR
jgi:phage gpG-like protein